VTITDALDCEKVAGVTVPSMVGVSSPFVHVLSIRPNPADDFIEIVTGLSTKDAEVILADISGRVVLQSPYYQRINISSVTPGCYMLRILSPDINATGRVMVVR